MDENEKKILTVTSFGHFMCHFNMLVFPALVLPLVARLNLGLSRVLALSFWMYLLFGITALPWGLLSDRVGAKHLLFLFYSGAGLCGLAAALFIDKPFMFSLSLAGVGLFSGVYHPAGLGLISRGVSRMSLALGYNGMAGNAGLASAPILAGVINHLFNPQGAYLFLGALNLTGSALMLMIPLKEPGQKEEPESLHRKAMLAGFLVLCVCMILGGIAYRSATVILPSYFEIRSYELFEKIERLTFLQGTRNVAATAFTSLVFLIGIFGQYAGGVFADRFDPRKAYLAFHAMAMPMALAMAYATDFSLLMVSMGYMLFLLGMQPIENTLVAHLTPDRLRHSAYGTKFILTFGVGALSVHLVGWIEDIWSLPVVFIAMAGVSTAIVISILFLISATRN